ncbi:hypothetical protein [Vibrio fluvialis]|uniref:hypothetical protein n=1 Tax=Vibrio fluvialis TaxID=676 RepID=UPI001EEA7F09|nr:hypothetical protein [Vibrio fluvialis]MCG6380321.1 hypothetical protein [Vibrio fluvialis]
MNYFVDSNNNVFAFVDEDLVHDSQVRTAISDLEQQEKEGLIIDGKVTIDNVEYMFSDVLTTLKSQIRINSSLVPVTKEDAEAILTPSEVQLDRIHALTEHAWVKSELEGAQVELMYFWTEDIQRQKATEESWKSYIIALRDYTSCDNDGVITLTGDSRPLKPV